MKGREMYPKDLAEKFIGSKEKYRPSNGAEGEMFCEMFCYQCKHWVLNGATDTYGCQKWIHDNTLFYDIDDPEYPKQWKHDTDGQPICTAFRDKSIPPKKRKPRPKPIPLFEDSTLRPHQSHRD